MRKLLPKQKVAEIVSNLHLDAILNVDYLYDVYEMANEVIDYLEEENAQIEVKEVNQFDLLLYSIGEYHYSVSYLSEENRNKFIQDEQVASSMASVAADKYLSLSIFNHVERKLSNRFLPPASSLYLYLNFMLNIVKGYKKNDPQSSLISDLLMKSLTISRCILDELLSGYETEAFSSWRTLHECECTLILLDRHGEPLINRYLKHMNYGFAFNNTMDNKEEQDKVFYEMKEEMRTFNLKSKDIKKYIEYGWLYQIVPSDNETFKLNFRDGLQKLAGLEIYAKRYEISSEIVHSTPLLIYSNKDYFYYMTLLSLYESFFRLENVFVSLLSKRVNPEQMKQYRQMRSVYYAQLVTIHKRELQTFKNMQAKVNKKGHER
ncbi:MAG TPA: hypothetical protein GX010_03325 [Erysipelotrichaceae bacterium]|nr:hypothetical protein [Erysipelotrichaceae bacterium]